MSFDGLAQELRQRIRFARISLPAHKFLDYPTSFALSVFN
jgi:hypothetical protein